MQRKPPPGSPNRRLSSDASAFGQMIPCGNPVFCTPNGMESVCGVELGGFTHRIGFGEVGEEGVGGGDGEWRSGQSFSDAI